MSWGTLSIADGSYPKKMAAYANMGLIALDDWGLDQLTREQSLDLLELLENRHGLKSTLVAAQVFCALVSASEDISTDAK